jgi:hypothetical protein
MFPMFPLIQYKEEKTIVLLFFNLGDSKHNIEIIVWWLGPYGKKAFHIGARFGHEILAQTWPNKVIGKVRRLGGARMASFGIIGHQMRKLGMKFYKTKWLGPKLVLPPILVVNWVSSSLSFFLSASSAAMLHILSLLHLYNYYKYSRTLCNKCWVSTFHTEV